MSSEEAFECKLIDVAEDLSPPSELMLTSALRLSEELSAAEAADCLDWGIKGWRALIAREVGDKNKAQRELQRKMGVESKERCFPFCPFWGCASFVAFCVTDA